MKIFKLPDLGEGLPDAEIHAWHIKEGDEVKLDQIIVSMETAKAVVDVPAPRTGKIVKFYGKAGDIIKTGMPLLEFADGEDKDQGTVVGNLQMSAEILQESATGVVPIAGKSQVKASPMARILAKKLNVDLSALQGSGKDGMITESDVQNATQKVAKAPQAGFEALKGMRRAMVLSMVKAHQEVVPATVVDDADISAWIAKPDVTYRIIRALLKGVAAEPALNAWYDGEQMARKLMSSVHLGMALDSAEGLMVPVIKNIEQLKPSEIRQKIDAFKTAAQTRSIDASDLKDWTIMLSNFGVFAGRYATPVLVPPCVAILGTGKIRNKMLPLSISFDHRAVTGGEATRFLAAIMQDLALAE